MTPARAHVAQRRTAAAGAAAPGWRCRRAAAPAAIVPVPLQCSCHGVQRLPGRKGRKAVDVAAGHVEIGWRIAEQLHLPPRCLHTGQTGERGAWAAAMHAALPLLLKPSIMGQQQGSQGAPAALASATERKAATGQRPHRDVPAASHMARNCSVLPAATGACKRSEALASHAVWPPCGT